jgi:hypothetical protein
MKGVLDRHQHEGKQKKFVKISADGELFDDSDTDIDSDDGEDEFVYES